MNTPILTTKIHCPPPPAKLVRRPLLLQKLNEGLESGREITLVSAPAGFGKTTCISEWRQSLDMPAAWLSLDPADDDPGRFFVYLIAALQTIDPTLGKEIEAVIKTGQIPPGDIFSTSIINDISEFEGQFLLVLDDFHVIQDNNILEAFNVLLDNQPWPLHLIFITREDPPLPLARLRANNKLTEIRARDLRFSKKDTESFLNGLMALGLSNNNIDMLEEKTEGWIAGLQLAGLSIRDHDDPSEFISRLSGSHRFILSYLMEQVLSQQPEEVREFLLQTAILDKFNADLCNAVTGRSDAGTLLDNLMNANLFLVPLDDAYHWFRYHNFFADLLRMLHSRDEVHPLADLHQRASQWYAEAGMASEAIHHALAAQDYPMAMDLLERHAFNLLMRGYAKTVDTWIQALPEEWRAKSPKTNLAYAWVYLLQGAYADIAEFIGRGKPPEDAGDASLWAEWLVMKSLLLYMHGEIDACMQMVTEALEKVPEQDHRVLGLAAYVQGHVHLLRGNYPQAVELFLKSIRHSRAAKSLVPEMMSTISLVGAAVERGKLNQAYEIGTQAITRLENSDELPPISAFVYLSLGEIYFQWNQQEAAHQVTARAFQLSSLGGLNTGRVYCRMLFSRLFQIKQNLEAAAAEVQGAVELLPLEVPEYIRLDVAAQQVRVFLDLSQLDSAETILQRHQAVLNHLETTQKVIRDDANPFSVGLLVNSLLHTMLRRESGSTNLNAGQEIATRLLAEADRKGQFLVALETLLVRAQFYEQLGNRQASHADLQAALERGRPEGFIGVFVAQGLPIAEMLRDLLKKPALSKADQRYVKTILDAFPQSPKGSPAAQPLIDPLTDRELDVLLLLNEGLKYKEIAAELFVSMNTVRYHVKAIYSKLNVSNRTQAIDRARKLQII